MPPKRRCTVALRKEVEKGITIGTAYAFGAALGGIERVSAKAAGAMEFVGAVGGLIGAMTTPPGWNDLCEGVASASGALLGLALTAPPVATRKIQSKSELEAKGKVERMLLKEGVAAQDMVVGAVGARAAVGAGYLE